MRRKIIKQQIQLEANDLNIDLENNRSSAMYNKDLYNGVIQIVEDTLSRMLPYRPIIRSGGCGRTTKMAIPALTFSYQ
jgi:hypothetical protein